jgi:hypothetical protein
MRAIRKPVAATIPEDKNRPATVFKASLRAWQAQYKARRAAQTPLSEAEKAQNQVATA